MNTPNISANYNQTAFGARNLRIDKSCYSYYIAKVIQDITSAVPEMSKMAKDNNVRVEIFEMPIPASTNKGVEFSDRITALTSKLRKSPIEYIRYQITKYRFVHNGKDIKLYENIKDKLSMIAGISSLGYGDSAEKTMLAVEKKAIEKYNDCPEIRDQKMKAAIKGLRRALSKQS